MTAYKTAAPTPDLRIVHIDHVFPHETHDSQRSRPLIEAFRSAATMTNPPIVSPMDDNSYVILDGANRCHALCALGYQHILVQVVGYDSGYVALDVWQHVVSDWDAAAFEQALHALDDVLVSPGRSPDAAAHILFRTGGEFAVSPAAPTLADRNQTLQQVVALYQRSARLYRTAIADPGEIWGLYPNAVALVQFQPYTPQEIMASAQQKAFLPPGVSRHIINGRALKVNYPLDHLRDTGMNLEEKNQQLMEWVQARLAKRAVRYYAESTYHFDE